MLVAVAQGAAVPPLPGFSGGDIDDEAICWFAICTDGWGVGASGSWSQENREPNRKCWTTGNLERTSALNILIIPFHES
jgi:hypothetical protein